MTRSGQYKNSKRTIPQGGLSIHRAVCLLREVSNLNDQGARLPDLVKRVGLNVATARRILKVLVYENLLTYDPVEKVYRLGIKLYYVGVDSRQFQIRERCRFAMERISQISGDTTYLIIRLGYDALYIDRVEGTFPLRDLADNIGNRAPLGIGAASLALLAGLPEEQIEKAIRANKSKYQIYNNRNDDYIRSGVRKTKKAGYSISEGNVTPGALGIGFPIKNSKCETVAAISVSSVSSRMTEDHIKEIIKLAKSEIDAINLDFKDK